GRAAASGPGRGTGRVGASAPGAPPSVFHAYSCTGSPAAAITGSVAPSRTAVGASVARGSTSVASGRNVAGAQVRRVSASDGSTGRRTRYASTLTTTPASRSANVRPGRVPLARAWPSNAPRASPANVAASTTAVPVAVAPETRAQSRAHSTS